MTAGYKCACECSNCYVIIDQVEIHPELKRQAGSEVRTCLVNLWRGINNHADHPGTFPRAVVEKGSSQSKILPESMISKQSLKMQKWIYNHRFCPSCNWCDAFKEHGISAERILIVNSGLGCVLCSLVHMWTVGETCEESEKGLSSFNSPTLPKKINLKHLHYQLY